MDHLTDWSTPSFELPPVAPLTGPFPCRSFLETWWDHRAQPGDRLLLCGNAEGLIPLIDRGDLVEFVGEPDLTDYHSPLGEGTGVLIGEIRSHLPGAQPFRFDSLPEEAAADLAAALASSGVEAEAVPHESAAVLQLPTSFDDWLLSIGKKERHEVRRKRRKCEAELGPLEVRRGRDQAALHVFFRMHRMAGGRKGSFMTDDLERFFADLVARSGAVVDTLTAGGRPIAAVFGWETGDAYYLYNSAYDDDVGGTSPGAVLVSMLIERQIERGASKVDFLKGDETYKYRLGATARPLYQLVGLFS